MSTTFASLGVSAPLCAVLAERGIIEPFPIQEATIADGLAGRDVCGQAPTGSGKTIAFGIPLVTGLPSAGPHRPRALVLAPTRELAAQIAAELGLLARSTGHRVHVVFGGVGYGGQRSALRRGVDVLVACPGRLEDLLQQGALELGDVERVVVDEADRMADMGFIPAVRRLLDATAPSRQTMLFSATLDGPVGGLSAAYQRDPVRHEVAGRDLDGHVVHEVHSVSREFRVRAVADLIGEQGSTIVFCRTRRGVDRLVRHLDRLGVKAVPIHGGRNQNQRNRALDSFARGGAPALVATDVAARGIHVDGVGCVIHYDPPGDADTYLHRSGRTGRAGEDGVVVSLVVDAAQRREADRVVASLLAGAQRPAPVRSERAAPVRSERAAPVRAERAAPVRAERAAPLRPARRGPRGGASRPSSIGPSGSLSGLQGEVKFFDRRRGFGFISHERRELFVHHTNVDGGRLRAGQQVRFEIAQGRKGDEARKVVVV